MPATHFDISAQVHAQVAMLRALASSSVVSITGFVGAGKSTIASLVSTSWQNAHPGGHVICVPLRDVSTPDGTAEALHAAFGLGVEHKAEGVELAAAVLASRTQTLVWLDNADACLGDLMPFLRALDPLSHVRVLLTSRAHVNLAGALGHHVPPLGQEDARLFLLAQLGQQEQTALHQDLKQLFELVEPTPQVLTLLAPHLRYISPADLKAELLPILGLSATALGTQESFGGRLCAILGGISALERRVLELCSVFQAGPSVDMLLNLDESLELVPLVATLERLHGQSLLTTTKHHDGVTIHVYPTLKLCVWEQLPLGRRHELLSLHRDHFIAHLQQTNRAHLGASLALGQWTKRWLSDLEQAFAHRDKVNPAGIIESLWTLEPHLRHLLNPGQHRALVETLLDEGPPPALCLPLWCIKARLCREAMEQEEAAKALLLATKTLGPNASAHDRASVLLAQVQLAHTRGDQTTCLRLTKDLLCLVDPCEHPDIHLEAETYLVSLTFSADKAFCKELLVILDRARAIQNVYAELAAHHNLASSLMRQNHDGEARHHYQSILDLAQALGSDKHQSIALLGLRNIETRQDHIEAALGLMLKSLAIAQRSGNQLHLQHVSNYHGLLLLSVGDYTHAHHVLEQTQSFLRRHPNDHAQVINIATLATLSHLQGDLRLAGERYHEALELSAAQGWRYWGKAQGHFYLALCLLEDNRHESALDALKAGSGHQDASSFGQLCHLLHDALLDPDSSLADRIPAWPPILTKAGHLVEAIRTKALDTLQPQAPCWFCLRLLWQMGQSLKHRPSGFPHLSREKLEIHPTGRFFIAPNGEPVDMSRRGPMRKVLVALGQRHRQQESAPLSLDELFAIGWPQEQHVTLSSAHKRVYAAIATLRQLGIGQWLVTTDQGYQLDPVLEVIQGDEG